FGLTIGAILLAVLVVYILVVPADRPEGVSLETLNPDGTIATPVDPGAAEAVEPGPLAVNTPPAEPQPALVEPEITRTPTLDAPAEIDWAALLYRTQAAGIETRTPPTSPRGPRVAESVATPVADAPMPRDLPATPSTYTVQPNDSLWTISQKVFGD